MSTTVRNSKIGFNDIEKIAQQIRSLKKKFNEIENKKPEYQQFHKKKIIELQEVHENMNLYKTKLLQLLYKPKPKSKSKYKSRTKSQYRKNVLKKQELQQDYQEKLDEYKIKELELQQIITHVEYLLDDKQEELIDTIAKLENQIKGRGKKTKNRRIKKKETKRKKPRKKVKKKN